MHPECTVTSFSRSEHRDHMRYLTVQPLAANTNSDDAYKEGVYVSSTHLLYELFFLTRCCEEPRVWVCNTDSRQSARSWVYKWAGSH